MSRRDNPRNRCTRCRMRGHLCICSLIPHPRIETRTRVVLIIHRFEDRKPTNTGRLAVACLANTETIVRGYASRPTQPFLCAPDTQPLLLFPYEGATPIAELTRSTMIPVTLIVPDGNWRQAAKVRNRVPGLRDIPCVFLPVGAPSTYRLRTETHEAGLATIEAIARAMGVLEGHHVQVALERIFRVMVDRTLWLRGAVPTADVSGGIPDDLTTPSTRFADRE